MAAPTPTDVIRVRDPLLTRTSRVVHAHPLRSYGPGHLAYHDGADHAAVDFDDGHRRTVRLDDLSQERAVPHVARPVQRIVYPRALS